jgi:hypothetical protein
MPNYSRQTVKFKFSIGLQKDDRPVLEYIAKILGIGTICKYNNSVIFSVQKYDDIRNVILPIFKTFPLHTTKAYDFNKFAQAVNLKPASGSYSNAFFKLTLALKNQMNTQRDPSLTAPACVINPYWLIGFIEGEDSFGIGMV